MPIKVERWMCKFCGREFDAQTAAIHCEQFHNRPFPEKPIDILYRVGEVQPCGVRVQLEDGQHVIFGEDTQFDNHEEGTCKS